jgi:hypothetical protein
MENLHCMVECIAQKVIFRRRTDVVATRVQAGRLDKLQENQKKHGALVHGITKLCQLWHKCLGHLHYGVPPILKNLVQGLSDFMIEKEGVCKGCALGKHINSNFLSSMHNRERGSLHLIHSDVCGPMYSAFLTVNCHYITFIDDFSRRT